MPGRNTPLANGEFYHIYNRGSEKRNIFNQSWDYTRFKKTFFYYQFLGTKPSFSHYAKSKLDLFKPLNENRIVDIFCYCLMPNHFHFLLRQIKDGGISHFVSQLSNSYTKYFNIKYDRIGPLLQGAFKAVLVETDEQLLHLSRYIHLNPIVAGLTNNLEEYPWSSYIEYVERRPAICSIEEILNFFSPENSYKQFVEDHIDYAKSLEIIKHQLIDIDIH